MSESKYANGMYKSTSKNQESWITDYFKSHEPMTRTIVRNLDQLTGNLLVNIKAGDNEINDTKLDYFVILNRSGKIIYHSKPLTYNMDCILNLD